jgi:uncharacterized membrane protein
LSFVSQVLHDLVDGVLDQVKEGIDGYANTARIDIDQFVDRILRRVVKAMVPAVLGIVLVSAGLLFSLVGLVTFLIAVVGPALAWGIVGLGMVGLGAALILPLLRRHDSRMTKHASHLKDRN